MSDLSSLTRDWACVPCIARQILNHWTTREVPNLKDFKSYLANIWNECNCTVVWTFFGIAFLSNWNENWLFPVLWPLLNFPNLLAYWVLTSTASSFRIWNSSAGVPSPPLALFIVVLPKTHFSLVKPHLTLGCPRHHPICMSSVPSLTDTPYLTCTELTICSLFGGICECFLGFKSNQSDKNLYKMWPTPN